MSPESIPARVALPEVGHSSSTPTAGEPLPDRRIMMQVVGGAVGCVYAGMIGYPVYRYLASPAEKAAGEAAVREVQLPQADQLPKGTALMFKFGGKPAILIHHPDDSWTAYSAVCTHLACTVQYESAADRIFCACHGGVYNSKTGANVSGPPPRPLDRFQATVSVGSITISRGA